MFLNYLFYTLPTTEIRPTATPSSQPAADLTKNGFRQIPFLSNPASLTLFNFVRSGPFSNPFLSLGDPKTAMSVENSTYIIL